MACSRVDGKENLLPTVLCGFGLQVMWMAHRKHFDWFHSCVVGVYGIANELVYMIFIGTSEGTAIRKQKDLYIVCMPEYPT